MYTSTTRNVTVSVIPAYLDAESAPEKNLYVFSYTVVIVNAGDETLQLKSRHWKITDAAGHSQEVRGEGVVGEQPILKSGDTYQYTSGTPLPTPSGIMVGSYAMETADGKTFDVAIPAFSLDAPFAPRQMN